MRLISGKAYLPIVLASFALGLLLAISFTTQERLLPHPPMGRKKELIKTVRDLEKERQLLKNQLVKTRYRTVALEKKAATSQGLLTSFSSQIDQAELAAGLKKVKGPGVVVLLADSPTVPMNKEPANYIVHDYDLRVAVNALWSGGAEAISINGQRLISNSSIRCVGTTILVNSVRLASPYEIKAIGKPEDLDKALKTNSDASQVVAAGPQLYGLVVSITQERSLVVSAYAGSLGINYARSINE